MAENEIDAFHVQNTREDIRALTRAANSLWNTRLLRLMFYLGLALWIVLMLAVLPEVGSLIFGDEDSLVRELFPPLSGVALLAAGLWWYRRTTQRNATDPRSAFARGYAVEAGAKGLHLYNDEFDTLYRWGAFVKVKETKNYVFLFTDRRMGVVISRRFFPSDDAFSRFATFVRSHVDPAALNVE